MSVPRTSARSVAFPALLQRAGKNAIFAAYEFFSARPPRRAAAPMPIPWGAFSPGAKSRRSSCAK